jgi:hypothetical protein
MMQYIQDYIIMLGISLVVLLLAWIINYLKNKYFTTIDKQEKNFLVVLRVYWILFQPFIFIANKFEPNSIILIIFCVANASFIIFFIQLLRLIFNNQKIIVYQYYQSNKAKAVLCLTAYILWGYLFIASLFFQLIRFMAHEFGQLNNIPLWIEIILLLIPIFGEVIFKFNKHIRASAKI